MEGGGSWPLFFFGLVLVWKCFVIAVYGTLLSALLNIKREHFLPIFSKKLLLPFSDVVTLEQFHAAVFFLFPFRTNREEEYVKTWKRGGGWGIKMRYEPFCLVCSFLLLNEGEMRFYSFSYWRPAQRVDLLHPRRGQNPTLENYSHMWVLFLFLLLLPSLFKRGINREEQYTNKLVRE